MTRACQAGDCDAVVQVVLDLVSVLQHENQEVASNADQVLDVIMEFDTRWAFKIRVLKFEAHNSQWLDAIQNGTSPIGATDSDVQFDMLQMQDDLRQS